MATLRREEIPHNTPNQVREYLSEALSIVTELEVPDELLEAAFLKAVELVAAKQIAVEQVGMGIGGLQLPPQG